MKIVLALLLALALGACATTRHRAPAHPPYTRRVPHLLPCQRHGLFYQLRPQQWK